MCNIITRGSCENNIPKDYIWIHFSSAHDLQTFINILFDDLEASDEMRKRAASALFPHRHKAWLYYVNVVNNEISLSLRFPKSDYDWVCERMEKHLSSEYVFVGQFVQNSKFFTFVDLNIFTTVKKGTWNVWSYKYNGIVKEIIIGWCLKDILEKPELTEYYNFDFKWQDCQKFHVANRIFIDYDEKIATAEENININGVTLDLHGFIAKDIVETDHCAITYSRSGDKVVGIKIEYFQ